ncbi:MAG: WG repeat-containing protein, partial [Bacteroidales bacterium]
YINKHGKIAIRCYKYSANNPFYNGIASLKDTIHYFLIDTTGKRINNTIYLNIGNWDTYGHLMVMDTAKNVRWINKQRSIVGDTMDKSVFVLFTFYNSDSGKHKFNKGNIWFGNVKLENDLFPVSKWGDEFGFINMKTKKIVIAYQYSDAGLFHSGLAPVLEDEEDKWGFIDKTNKLIINFQYNLVHQDGFKDGIKSKVKNDYYEDWWWIDKTGTKLNLPREKD